MAKCKTHDWGLSIGGKQRQCKKCFLVEVYVSQWVEVPKGKTVMWD